MATNRYTEGSVGALFDGQGIYGRGMGELAHKRYAAAREVFKGASDAVGVDMARVCFGDLLYLQEDPRIVQPAIITVDLAEHRAWCEKEEREPDVITGLSMGMYAGMAASGVTEDAVAVGLAAERARIIHDVTKRNRGQMAAILGLLKEEVAHLLPETGVNFAVFRDERHFVVSGTRKAIGKVKNLAKEKGARRAEVLKINGAFHHPILERAVAPMRTAFDSATMTNPRINLMSNDADYLPTASSVAEHLLSQITETSDWEATMDRLADEKLESVVEFGPDDRRGLTRQMVKNYKMKAIIFPSAS